MKRGKPPTLHLVFLLFSLKLYVSSRTHEAVTRLIINSYRSQLQASSSHSPTPVAQLFGLPILSPLVPQHLASRSRQRRRSKRSSSDFLSHDDFLPDYAFGNMFGSGPKGTTGDFEAPAYPCLILSKSVPAGKRIRIAKTNDLPHQSMLCLGRHLSSHQSHRNKDASATSGCVDNRAGSFSDCI